MPFAVAGGSAGLNVTLELASVLLSTPRGIVMIT
jgi:hypothetical protein